MSKWKHECDNHTTRSNSACVWQRHALFPVCVVTLLEVALHRAADCWLSPGRLKHTAILHPSWSSECEIPFNATLLSPLTGAGHSVQAAAFHLNFDPGRLCDNITECGCISVSISVHFYLILSLPQHFPCISYYNCSLRLHSQSIYSPFTLCLCFVTGGTIKIAFY